MYQIIYKNKKFQAYCPKEFHNFKERVGGSYRKSLGCWQFNFDMSNYNEVKELEGFVISDKVHNHFKKMHQQLAAAKTRNLGARPGKHVQLSNGKVVSWEKHCEYHEVFWPLFDKFNWIQDEEEKQYLKRILQEIIGREITDKEYNKGF